jgi:hypothetical protein
MCHFCCCTLPYRIAMLTHCMAQSMTQSTAHSAWRMGCNSPCPMQGQQHDTVLLLPTAEQAVDKLAGAMYGYGRTSKYCVFPCVSVIASLWCFRHAAQTSCNDS